MKIRFWEWGHRLLGRPRFTVAYAQNAWMSLDLRDFIQFEIAKTGGYEPEVWEKLSAYAQHREVVWDVGANVGSFALRAATDARVQEVHAFEPSTRALEALRKNQSLNPHINLHVHAIGLAADTRNRALFEGLDANLGVAGFSPTWNQRSTVIPCFKGDDWLSLGRAKPPTLLKLDVEGAELEVLQGLEQTLRNTPPKAIIFEAHWGNGGHLFSQPVVDFLARLGFATHVPEAGTAGQPVNLVASWSAWPKRGADPEI